MKWKVAALAGLLVFRVTTAFPCQSFLDPKGRSSVDFAPPEGFVEICSDDTLLLCTILTMGMTSSARDKIVSYFIPNTELERARQGAAMGFELSLIVSRLEALSLEKFESLKAETRKKGGDIWRGETWPNGQQPLDYVPMGIITEAENLISVGMRARYMGFDLKSFEKGEQPTKKKEMTVSSVYTTLQLGGETLLLSVVEQRYEPFDGESTKSLAAKWLDCVKAGNHN